MPTGGNAPEDPYHLREVTDIIGAWGFSFPQERIRENAAIVAGQATAVIVVSGQSVSANYAANLYTPTHTSVHNFNIYDGGVYQAKDPLLGCTGTSGNWLGYLGDKLIVAGTFERVILVPISVGGTECARWAAGGDCNHRIVVVCKRLAAAGITPSAWLWSQGEVDVFLETTTASYQASLQSVIDTIRAQGVDCPVFVNQETWRIGVTSDAIRAAQAAVVDHANGIWLGADFDTLDATYRQSDNIHFNDTGCDAAATLVQTAFAAYGAPF